MSARKACILGFFSCMRRPDQNGCRLIDCRTKASALGSAFDASYCRIARLELRAETTVGAHHKRQAAVCIRQRSKLIRIRVTMHTLKRAFARFRCTHGNNVP